MSGLHIKLAAVMAEAGRIPKNGTAPAAMGGYRFVQVGDAADAIRTALSIRGVSMLPSAVEVISEAEHETSRGGTMTTITIRTTWTLTDGETGETATIQSLGTGADSGDKYSPKAQTNAMKYALLMGFLLSTGDDPEASDSSDRGRRREGVTAPVAVPPAPPLAAGDERLTHRGQITRVGTVVKGGGRHSDLAARQVPDGLHIGFRLELEDDKAIPQVVATGALGQELLGACGDSANLVGMLVEVTGDLFEVRVPQRQMVHRLVASRIATPDWTIPSAVQPVQDAPHADLEDVMAANGVSGITGCGSVAAGGLMAGSVCILDPHETGAHKSADGSWPR